MNCNQPPPPEYVCGLTQKLMVEPMCSKHGHHFERNAIEEWIALGNHFCPVSGNPLLTSDLVLNKSLQWSISQWKAQQGRNGAEEESTVQENNDGRESSSSVATPSSSVPQHFRCPLTQKVMDEPVTTEDGVSYERAAILKWLKEQDTCPVTQKLLSRSLLVPNTKLQDAIDQWQMESLTSSLALSMMTSSLSSSSLHTPTKSSSNTTASTMKRSRSAATMTSNGRGSGVPSSILHGMPISRRRADQVDRFKRRFSKKNLIAALDEAIDVSSYKG